MSQPFSLSELKHNTIWELDKGVHYDKNARSIPPGGATSSHNMIHLDGHLRPRPGLLECYQTGSTAPCVGLAVYEPLVGDPVLARFSMPDAESVDLHFYEDGAWVKKNSSHVAGSIEQSVQAVSFRGELFFATGYDNLQVYRPSLNDVVAVDTQQPVVDFRPFSYPQVLARSDARLLLAGLVEDDGTLIPYRAAWSDMLRPYHWRGRYGTGSAEYVDLCSETDPITAIWVEGAVPLFFKRRAVYAGKVNAGVMGHFDSKHTYSIQRMVTDVGCVAAATLHTWKDKTLLWLGDDGVYLWQIGEGKPTAISDPVAPWLREKVDLLNLQQACAVLDYDNQMYHLFLPGLASGRVNLVASVNLKSGAWWTGEIENADIDITATLTRSTDPWVSECLLGTSSGKILALDYNVAEDDGVPFGTEWVSGVFSGELLTQGNTEQVNVQTLRAFAATGKVSLSLLCGDGLDRFVASPTPSGVQTFDGKSPLYLSGRACAEHFKICVRHVPGVDPAYVAGVGIGWMPMGDTR